MSVIYYSNFNNNKIKPIDFLLQREKNNASNNRSAIFEDNNFEYKLCNSNSNFNLFNYKENGYPHIARSKILNDSTMAKMNMIMNNSNKSTLMKRSNFNDGMYNYNSVLASRNLGIIGTSKKQQKLSLFDLNKNFGLFNKDKKTNYKNKNKLYYIKEIPGSKNHSNVNSVGKNKISSSAEPKNIKISRSQKNIMDENNNYYVYYPRNLTNNYIINKNGVNLLKEQLNRSSDEFPTISNKSQKNHNYNNDIIIFNKNMNNGSNTQKSNNLNQNYSQKSSFKVKKNTHKSNSLKNDNISLNNYDIKNENIYKTQKKLSFNKDITTYYSKIDGNNKSVRIANFNKSKEELEKNREKAFEILSQSKVLKSSERFFFSKIVEKMRALISAKEIEKANNTFLKNKIKELEQQIKNYNSIINTPFVPSKIAIISLNLITKDDEEDFINFIKNNENIKTKEKEYYYLYVGLLFVLFNEKYDEKDIENYNANILHNKLNEKGYENFKDYLYKNHISKKNGDEFNESQMIQFSDIFERMPDLIKYQGEIKNCRFISFSYFLLHEIYNYWNKFKNVEDVKIKAQSYIQSLKKKF
jgi:hypothetical protein